MKKINSKRTVLVLLTIVLIVSLFSGCKIQELEIMKEANAENNETETVEAGNVSETKNSELSEQIQEPDKHGVMGTTVVVSDITISKIQKETSTQTTSENCSLEPGLYFVQTDSSGIGIPLLNSMYKEDVLLYLPNKSEVKLISCKSDWAEVEFEQYIGWVDVKYLTEE